MLIRDQLDYPKVAGWVRHELPHIPEKPTVWKAFKKHGQLNSFVALQAINWRDESPLLRIKPLGSDNGAFDPNHPDWIMLAQEVATRFETDHTRAEAQLLLESTILHELVHWGDHRDGHDQAGEEGKAFEQEAYDGDVSRYWSAPTAPSLNIRAGDLPGLDGNWKRGIRNHNPGNIKRGSDWDGLATEAEMTPAQRDESVFCVFRDATWGIRAMVLLLAKYQGRGEKTVARMIATWAPQSDANPTHGYVAFVAEHMHIGLDEEFSVRDFELARRMVEAMIAFENGTQPYEDAIIEEGLKKSGIFA